MSSVDSKPEIHRKERIGRRAFGQDKDVFNVSKGQRHFKLDVFVDSRPGGLSVDRLGVGQVVPKRIQFLSPLGVAMGEKRKKVFRGWAQLCVSTIHRIVEATAAEGEDNPFHAEILRDELYPTVEAKRALAFQLCVLAQEHAFVVCPSCESDVTEI